MTSMGTPQGRLAHASLHDDGYPRPILRRADWMSLDGLAGFAYDDANLGIAQQWWLDQEPFERTIVLPFPPESPASGIGEDSVHPLVWYRIEVSDCQLAACGHRPGRRLLLHFGAVDHRATVWVDGVRVGDHEGGQSAFSFDITDALAPPSRESSSGPAASQGGSHPPAASHVIVVRAFDDPYDRSQPRGKQTWRDQPESIWYERCTGIWRPVWLESVPPAVCDPARVDSERPRGHRESRYRAVRGPRTAGARPCED